MGTPVTAFPVPTKTLAEAIAQIVAALDTHLGSTMWRTAVGATYSISLTGDTLRLTDGTTNQDIDLTPYKDGGALASTVPLTPTLAGAVGTGTALTRADHRHPAEGPSADADNLVGAGTDGRSLLTLSASEQSIPMTGTYVLGWVNGVLSAIPA